MEHGVREADTNNWIVLHRWNFYMGDNGEFVVESVNSKVNATKVLEPLASVDCKVSGE
jgi:hypothetical protein